jgi:predicted metal-dependent peptidase
MTAELPPRVQRARVRLMLDQPYLAAALARLPTVNAGRLDWCDTMATDGYYIYVNPDFTERLSDDELAFVFAHELVHCVLGHIDRRGDRDPILWNHAIDYATNLLLVQFGLTMPSSGLLDQKYRGMTAEDIYRQLQERRPQSLQGARAGAGTAGQPRDIWQTPGGFDVHLDPQDERDASIRAEDFPSPEERKRLRIGLAQAVRNALPGHMSGALASEVEAATTSSVPWQMVLARFVNGLRRSDYRLYPPNRKHIWRRIYLPSLGVPGPEHLVVAVDTSGSMTDAILSQVLGELDRLRAVTECRLTLLQCDAAVQQVDEFDSFETTIVSRASTKARTFRFAGRGGTDFSPIFDWVGERVLRGTLRLDALIILTDGYGPFPPQMPYYPVLWIVTEHGARDIPFGTQIRLAG